MPVTGRVYKASRLSRSVPEYYLCRDEGPLGFRYFLGLNSTLSSSSLSCCCFNSLLLICQDVFSAVVEQSSRVNGILSNCWGSGYLMLIVEPSLKTSVVGYRRAKCPLLAFETRVSMRDRYEFKSYQKNNRSG